MQHTWRSWILGLALLVAAMAGSAFAQDTLSADGLPTLQDVIRQEEISTVTWFLTFDEHAQREPMDPERVANGLLSGQTFGATGKEAEFVFAFRGQAANVVERLGYLDGISTGFMLDPGQPVVFFAHDGQIGVLISSLGLAASFNTFSTTYIERIRRVMYDMIIPELNALESEFGEYGIGYAGIAITHGAYDFTEDFDLGSPELVVGIFSMADIRDFGEFLITDAELADQGLIFGGSINGVRRVEMNR